MSSPVGVVPESFFRSEHKDSVIEFIRSLPLDARTKAGYLRGWCYEVGTRATADDFRRVEETGIDR